jgi:hypothetical protein
MKDHFPVIQIVANLRRLMYAGVCICVAVISSCSMVRVEQDGRLLSESIYLLTSPPLPRPQQGLVVYRTTALGAFSNTSMLGVGAVREILAFTASPDACGTIMFVESLPLTPPPWLHDLQRRSPNLLCVAELSPKETVRD